jgi:hypothetical protein
LIYDLDIDFYRFFGDKDVRTGESNEGFLKWFDIGKAIADLRIIPSDPWMISSCLGGEFRNFKSKIRNLRSVYFLHSIVSGDARK